MAAPLNLCFEISKYFNFVNISIRGNLNFVSFVEFSDKKVSVSPIKKSPLKSQKEKAKYVDLVRKIETYLSPEKQVIESCLKKGQTLQEKRNFTEASQYFARVLVIAQSGSLEYNEAKRKLGVCLQRS